MPIQPTKYPPLPDRPGLPGIYPDQLHLDIPLPLLSPPSAANPLGLPVNILIALARLPISRVRPLIRVPSTIWPLFDPNTVPLSPSSPTRAQWKVLFELTKQDLGPKPAGPVLTAERSAYLRSSLIVTVKAGTSLPSVIGPLAAVAEVAHVGPVPILRPELARPSSSPPAPAPIKGGPVIQSTVPAKGWGHTITNWSQPTTKWTNIAVLDSGFDQGHPGIKAGAVKIIPTDPLLSDLDTDGHGTHIAGLLLGKATGSGQKGLLDASKSSIYSFKIFYDDSPLIYYDRFYLALDLILNNYPGVKVINLSIWMTQTSPKLESMFAQCEAKGIVFAVCAGNCFRPDPDPAPSPWPDPAAEINPDFAVSYPASFENMLSVGAINDSRQRAEFSRFSTFAKVLSKKPDFPGNDPYMPMRFPLVDIMAPGQSMLSTLPSSNVYYPSLQYGRLDGTSMATPYIAAVAGWLRSRNQTINAKDLRKLVVKSFSNKGPDKLPTPPKNVDYKEMYGVGLLNYTKIP